MDVTALAYEQQVEQLVTNTLLHLFCSVSENKRYVPVKARNHMATKHLKAQLKNPVYRGIKKEIKALMSVGKKQGCMEFHMMKLYDWSREKKEKYTDIDYLYLLMIHLLKTHGMNSVIFNEEDVVDNTLYINASEIEHGFDDDNKQIQGVACFIRTDNLNVLIDSINQYGGYLATEQKSAMQDNKAGINYLVISKIRRH